MLLPPHILIKTVSQVTIPPRTITIVSTTFIVIPKPDCHCSFMELLVLYESQQHFFVVPVLKILVKNYQYTYYAQLLIQVLTILSCLKTDTLVI